MLDIYSLFFSHSSLFCPQLLSYLKQPGDYALSKDVNVALWLDCRASRGDPPLTDVGDFVIINSQLHDEFDQFKKAETKAGCTIIHMNELLQFYCDTENPPCVKVLKYDRPYIELQSSDVDTLVDWVYDMREQYQSGRRIFVPEEQTTGVRFPNNCNVATYSGTPSTITCRGTQQ